MSYEVLARKCRPQRFCEVVGQEHITRTLQNAINQNRVGHAYLFVGPRGTGKTTSARIFAKALNCKQRDGNEPCCKCTSCQEIASGLSLDVIEIDGASHNKVDDIREIRENVQYAPTRGPYKIYIIDEVHMLTTQAWNALLKTLEEPPAHVKFLFATTEPHKVLPTIISRCQRFDLKPIPVNLIMRRLKEISEQENIKIDEGALNAISRAANGGMRDAQSITDQMIAFCSGDDLKGKVITENDVIDVFGLASSSELRNLIAGMLRNDLSAVLLAVQALADNGRDLERLFEDITNELRNLMVCTVSNDAQSILDLSDNELQELQQLTNITSPEVVQRLLYKLLDESSSLRHALNKRIYLEVSLVRVMQDAHSVQLNDIVKRLNQLRQAGNTPVITINETHNHQALPSSIANIAEVVEPVIEAPIANSAEVVEPIIEEPIANPAEVVEPIIEEPIANPAEGSMMTYEFENEDTSLLVHDNSEYEQSVDNDKIFNQVWQRLLVALDKSEISSNMLLAIKKLQANAYVNDILALCYRAEFDDVTLEIVRDDKTKLFLTNLLQTIQANDNCQVIIKKWLPQISSDEKIVSWSSSQEATKDAEKNPFVQKVADMFSATLIDAKRKQ